MAEILETCGPLIMRKGMPYSCNRVPQPGYISVKHGVNTLKTKILPSQPSPSRRQLCRIFQHSQPFAGQEPT